MGDLSLLRTLVITDARNNAIGCGHRQGRQVKPFTTRMDLNVPDPSAVFHNTCYIRGLNLNNTLHIVSISCMATYRYERSSFEISRMCRFTFPSKTIHTPILWSIDVVDRPRSSLPKTSFEPHNQIMISMEGVVNSCPHSSVKSFI